MDVDENEHENGGSTVERREFLAALAWTVFGAAQARSDSSPRTSGKTVASLRRISVDRRAALERNSEGRSVDALQRLIPEIDEIEVWNGAAPARPGKSLRVVAWNMERGRHWEGGVRLIRESEALRDPDILLMGEMDLGMARSANAHTTRELAKALGMNYAYGVEFLELTGGEIEERKLYPGEDEWGYHGNAILSRYPLRNVRMLRFPGIEKWYEGKGANEAEKAQKRLGGAWRFRDVDLGRASRSGPPTSKLGQDSAAWKAPTRMLLDALRYAHGTRGPRRRPDATPERALSRPCARRIPAEESNGLAVGRFRSSGRQGRVL